MSIILAFIYRARLFTFASKHEKDVATFKFNSVYVCKVYNWQLVVLLLIS